MSRLTLLLLAITTLFLTPAGVFVCGSVTAALVLPGDGHGLTVTCEGMVTAQMADTAVSSYLSTPFLAAAITAVMLAFCVRALALLKLSPFPSLKRKPLTPPPNA